MKKLAIILVALIPVAIWLYKVGNVIDVEQHNDRAGFNNSVVRVLNDAREKIADPQSFLEQFAQLEQLNESQQRGMWFLLEDMNFDFQSDIEAAKAELQAIASGTGDEEALYVTEATELLDSYSGFAGVYNELATIIRAKTLDNNQLMTVLADEFDALRQFETVAIADFELAQINYMDGN